jgi:hypothetical protein
MLLKKHLLSYLRAYLTERPPSIPISLTFTPKQLPTLLSGNLTVDRIGWNLFSTLFPIPDHLITLDVALFHHYIKELTRTIYGWPPCRRTIRDYPFSSRTVSVRMIYYVGFHSENLGMA